MFAFGWGSLAVASTWVKNNFFNLIHAFNSDFFGHQIVCEFSLIFHLRLADLDQYDWRPSVSERHTLSLSTQQSWEPLGKEGNLIPRQSLNVSGGIARFLKQASRVISNSNNGVTSRNHHGTSTRRNTIESVLNESLEYRWKGVYRLGVYEELRYKVVSREVGLSIKYDSLIVLNVWSWARKALRGCLVRGCQRRNNFHRALFQPGIHAWGTYVRPELPEDIVTGHWQWCFRFWF
jgi:hypothetical protein